MSGTFNPFTMIGDNLMSSSLPWFWVKVAAWLFISIGIAKWLVGAYRWISRSTLERWKLVYSDFRQQRYYNPWSREHPVIIRDKAQMDELSAATELSQPAVYADIFGFKFTMADAETNRDPLDKSQARFRLLARTIRVIGGSQLPHVQPYLQARVESILSKAIASGDEREGGWKSVQLAPLMRDAASRPLALYIYGPRLTAQPEFVEALKKYYQDTMAFAGLLQVIPAWMQGAAHAAATNRGKAAKTLIRFLRSEILAEREELSKQGTKKEGMEELSLLHHMVDSSRDSAYWTTNVLIQALVGLWIAAGHQPWINLHFAICELCDRPEYIDLLRAELLAQERLDYPAVSRLPILDSFLKESIRLNALDRMAVRRKALQPYAFTKGSPHVQKDEITCVSSYELMRDEQFFPESERFDGLRFVKDLKISAAAGGKGFGNPMRGTSVTDVSKEYPVWGYGSHFCPGRYHASLVLKLIIIHLVSHYDFRLEKEKQPWKWYWDSFQLPYESTRILVRPRSSQLPN